MARIHHGSSARRRGLGLIGVGALAVTALAAPSGALMPTGANVGSAVTATGSPTFGGGDDVASERTFEDGRYIVVLKAPGAASYAGGTKGLRATRATGDGQFRPDSAASREYRGYLERQQDQTAERAGVDVERSFTVVTNGFTAALTAEQAMKLSADQRVAVVAPDEQRSVDTWNSPTELGLTGRDGAWARVGGRDQAGAGTVVGIIDSGLWKEGNGSFAGQALSTTPVTDYDITMDAQGNTRMEKADGTVFNGVCQTGEEWTLADCDSKIVGARYYADGFLDTVPEDEISELEYISPRDNSGHGSHTASTAAGRATNASVEGRKFGRISGMAPGAKIAVYKVCWEDTDEETGGCYSSASVAAVEDAVVDGVDVLNYSISGSATTVLDPVALAFEGAAEAGVFVAASAGNSGPTASTVNHNSPWLTTVAANTHARLEGTVRLGNRAQYVGASIIDQTLPPARLVAARANPAEGVTADDAALCQPDSLDPDAVAGKIVLCERGVNARVEKSAVVADAGGIGMILGNVSVGSLDAEFHSVPTVHVDDAATEAIYAYLEEAGDIASARLLPGNVTDRQTPVPQIAGFSSRGPALANDGGLLKPDLSGPGVSVLAAVAPPSNEGRHYSLYSGTSMSSPHIAGLAAMVITEHPTWTPMEIKSAMMTTAAPLRRADGKQVTDALAQGAGQVQPLRFGDPGLLVTSNARDWRAFISGQGLDTGVPAMEPQELNVPSFAFSAVPGSVTISRTFKATKRGTWTMRSYLPGFDVTASPARIVSTRVNDLITVDFTFTRTTAPLDDYRQGAITFTGPSSPVRMPVALQPIALDVPDVVQGEGTEGSTEVEVVSGETGTVDITPGGLTPAEREEGAVAAGAQDLLCYEVPEGTTTAVFDLDAADDTADLDLAVFKADDCAGAGAELVAQSATGDADEEAVVADPEPGTYIALVDGFSAGDQGSPIAYTMDTFMIGGVPTVGTLTATPSTLPVVQGESTTYELAWSGLEAGAVYRGEVAYSTTDDTTLVEIDATEGEG